MTSAHTIHRGYGHSGWHSAKSINGWSTSQRFVIELLLCKGRCYVSYKKATCNTAKLPVPRGPLYTKVSSSSIESANTKVKQPWIIGIHSLDHTLFTCHFLTSGSSWPASTLAEFFFHKSISQFEPTMVRGGAQWVLWVKQFQNIQPRKFNREIFADCFSAIIGSLENFQLYGKTKC